MPIVAFFIVLGSAVLHATWNFLMKRSEDRLVAAFAIATAGAVAFAPLLVVLGLPEARVWPHVLASGVVHVVYGASLAAAYERADLSVAYPVARGISPVLIGGGGALFLDDSLDALGWLGVALTTAGLLFVAFQTLRLHGVEWALVTGVAITTYTLIDTAGVRLADESLRYVVAIFVAQAVFFVPVIAMARGFPTVWRRFSATPWTYVGGGVFSVGAYALVLAAAIVAPIGAVSAVRETSVVFGSLAGWLLLDEDLGHRRTAGAAVVAAGVVLLAVA